jgi:hypothetical protein
MASLWDRRLINVTVSIFCVINFSATSSIFSWSIRSENRLKIGGRKNRRGPPDRFRSAARSGGDECRQLAARAVDRERDGPVIRPFQAFPRALSASAKHHHGIRVRGRTPWRYPLV